MRNGYQYRQVLPFLLLGAASLFFCWFFVGRYGIFGSNVDWISQHSVIPDYFRRQFYETGELFPEFAANIGGGQNIYHFSYYGLFSPVVLISYLLPFVRMGDYLMGASAAGLTASVELLYGWLLKRGFSGRISFMAALMYLLAGPMIFHSYCQIMFVNYMPFLCMAFFGVDHYFEKGGKLLYTVSVCLMILTSFYFSIGGMLVLILYGVYRYVECKGNPGGETECFPAGKNIACDINGARKQKGLFSKRIVSDAFIDGNKKISCSEKIACDGKEVGSEVEIKKNLVLKNIVYNIKYGRIRREAGRKNLVYKTSDEVRQRITIGGFLLDGIRFLWPMLTAVLLSGILLVPTAAALAGREGTKAAVTPASLLLPNLQADRLLYTPYGIGLPTLMITVLIAGFTYKKAEERVLSWGCTAVLTIPFFAWALNGGLYVRDKALIPCLPLLCYLIACYLKKLENKEISFVAGFIPFLVTMGLLAAGHGTSEFSGYVTLFLADAAVMAGCFLLFWKGKRLMVLMAPPVVFLILYGSVFHGLAGRIESREFYAKVTDPAIGNAVKGILEEDGGFYRLEQVGSEQENAADLNRIWDMGQYISSVYSSAYNREYQEFRKQTFGVEEPFRNDLMQSVSKNPVFRRLMGVRYLISEEEVLGCEAVGSAGRFKIYKDEGAAPAAYVTDRMISEATYDGLEFPYNQMILAYGAVGTGGKMDREIVEEVREALEPAGITMPEGKSGPLLIERNGDGYRIRAEKKGSVQIGISGIGGADAPGTDRILFLQFQVKNNHPSRDVTVWLEGERNKLTARNHFYYNGNTEFSYAVVLENGKTSAELSLGKGDYEITGITCFLGDWGKREDQERSGRLYQSEFQLDQGRTKGNVVAGSVDVEKDGYFVTSIPYDSNFDISVDGKSVEAEKVNTAFLGFSIGKGKHDVELVYHAPGRKAGARCSCAGAVLLIFSCCSRFPEPRRKASGR